MTSPAQSQSNDTRKKGRPAANFEHLSERPKRRRTAALRATASTSELVHATKTSLYCEGKRAAGFLVGEIAGSSTQNAVEVRKALKNPKKRNSPLYERRGSGSTP